MVKMWVTASGLYYNGSFDRSYNRNPSRLDHLAAEKFPPELWRNVPAYLDYDHSYDRSSVIVLATGDDQMMMLFLRPRFIFSLLAENSSPD